MNWREKSERECVTERVKVWRESKEGKDGGREKD
jgi:hypothetical protein